MMKASTRFTRLVSIFVMALLMLSITGVGMAKAFNPVPMDVHYLKIDGEKHDPYDNTHQVLEVKRGQSLPIKVKLGADEDVEDVQISAKITGYQYSDYEQNKIFEMTDTFDLDENRVDYKELELQVPMKVATGDIKLRIDVEDRNSNGYHKEYNLDIEGSEESDAVTVERATLSPSNTVKQGRALSALVKVSNLGDKDLDDVTLKASIPSLSIRDVETLDDLDVDEKETFEQVLLRFPKDTEPGDYRIDYSVTFDEYESTSISDMITVEESEDTTEEEKDAIQKTVVTIPESKEATADGSGAAYPITLNNNADTQKTYTVDVSGVGDWAMATLEPGSTVTVGSGQSSTTTLHVTPDEDAEPGRKHFTMTVGVGGKQKTVPLSLVVSEGSDSWDDAKDAIEIGLIVLVILLILLGLILGLRKLKGSGNEDEDEEAKTYY